MQLSSRAILVVGVGLLFFYIIFPACSPRSVEGISGKKIISEPMPVKSAPAPADKSNQPAPESCKVINDSTTPYFDFLASRIALEQGDIDSAISLLRSAIRKDPGALRPREDLAEILFRAGKKEEALKIAKEILAKDPQNIQALIIAASVYQAEKDLKAASDMLKRASEADPERKDLRIALGRIQMNLGDISGAVETFAAYTKKFPGDFKGFYFLGKALARQGKVSAAIAALNKASKLEPARIEALAEIALLYEKSGDMKSLASTYEKILKRDPKNLVAQIELGLCYKKAGNKKKADEIFSRLAQRARSDANLVSVIYARFVGNKRFDDAKNVINSIIEHGGGNSDLYYLAGAVEYTQGNCQDALFYLSMVDKDSCFYLDAVIHKALCLEKIKGSKEAVSYLYPIYKSADNSVKLRLIPFISSFYMAQDAYAKAAEILDEGLALDANNARMLYDLGVVYDKMGKPDEALKIMQKVLKLEPGNPDALNYVGYTYADKGMRLDEAEQMIKKALEAKPDNGYFLDSLGWVYFRQGRIKEAISFLEKAVEKTKNDPVILEHLGDAYTSAGMHEKAVKAYNKAKEQEGADIGRLQEKIDKILDQISR